ncbi:N-terminal glutamine amidase-domain-containing protein [Leucosporidium creatinivorum]|uniref:Protein N-terminal glutamine amidohydrolase n=1 Tax=Leucosporidium creatinivorum TaxID=106004 RepID=A0A1Y2EUZ7_9BASI|nr:N-terminal glutamine amidase-domain-containing protein [Leucosporidium creatinivorum]
MHLSPAPRPPPALPSPPPLHTPYYCEENVHLLLQSLTTSHCQAYALFITNTPRTALLFHQKASPPERADQEHYVVWDYHVVAATVEKDGSQWVWDQDSRLGCPVELQEYLETTFRPDLFALGVLPSTLASRFRLVAAQDLFGNFASDRSHMVGSAFLGFSSSARRSALTSPPSSSAPISTSALISLISAISSFIVTTFPRTNLHPPPTALPASPRPSSPRPRETMNLFERWLDVRMGSELEGEGRREGFGVVLKDVGELLGWSGWEDRRE